MILNPAQVAERILEREELVRLLTQEEEDATALQRFVGRDDLMAGLPGDWHRLTQEHARTPVSRSLPSDGHIFMVSSAGPDARSLKRLLVNLAMDFERSWEVPGQQQPWSAWLWVASTVFDDGVVDAPLQRSSWEVLLPHLLAAGMDLSLPMKDGKTRHDFLAKQNELRLAEAIAIADELRLQWETPVGQSCNSASRRL